MVCPFLKDIIFRPTPMVERKVFGLKVSLGLAIGLLGPVTRHSIRCKQSSIPMRLCAGLSAGKFALLARPRATSRTTDSLCLLESGLLRLHGHLWCSSPQQKDGQFCTETRTV